MASWRRPLAGPIYDVDSIVGLLGKPTPAVVLTNRDGLGYQQAAIVAAGLVEGARTLGQSGVKLEDTSRTGALGTSGDWVLD